MAGGRDVRAARALDREAQRVIDHAARDLVVAGEPGEDRQPRGVGGGPAGGPQPVGAQVQIAPEPACHPRAVRLSAYSS